MKKMKKRKENFKKKTLKLAVRSEKEIIMGKLYKDLKKGLIDQGIYRPQIQRKISR
jgi:hypothetical protein